MSIEIDIAHVARLARIELSETQADDYREQLGVILDHAALVQSLETDGVAPTAHPLDLVNGFRADEAGDSLDRNVVLSQAPDATEDGFFRVPPSLDNA